MQTINIYNMTDYLSSMDDYYAQVHLVEKLIAEEHKDKNKWFHVGYCEVCESACSFEIDWRHSDGLFPNYRESVVCPVCKLNSRKRFVITYLSNLLKKNNKTKQAVYCCEQTTRLFDIILSKFPAVEIIGSEYLGAEHRPGTIIDGIRHEDILNLSFNDEFIDVMLSNDVFEHVGDIDKAMSEAYRVIKVGGTLLFSIPFYSDRMESFKRTEIINGQLNHILPEQYHYNPISPGGSLVFYDFGWDILDICKQVGFIDVYAVGYHSFMYGYLGGMQLLFYAEK